MLNNTPNTVDLSASLIDALGKSDAYDHEVSTITLIETHISWVFLTGYYAYKIKKPVNFGFLNFSTLERRQFYCAEEIRLNQRLAADWYLEVVPITFSAERFKINGTATVIEYAVKMRQFPSTETLREACHHNQIRGEVIDQIAQLVADFHGRIEIVHANDLYGDAEEIKYWFDENFEHIRPHLEDPQQVQQLNIIAEWSDHEWMQRYPLIKQRKQQGFIRECHGDLHLGNMTLINGQVVLFDCIEFNPKLRWIDVISEIAFLVMDLVQSGNSDDAYRFLNHYLQKTGDYQGLALLRYYVVYRALVRAKVALLRKTQRNDATINDQIQLEYARFACVAEQFTQHFPLSLIITHGFSGSGKSTYARQLAQKIGAIQIRSDLERKRLHGYQALDNTESDFNKGIYTEASSDTTYQRLLELAKQVIDAGFPAIIDATFLKAEHRHWFRELANSLHIKFYIVDVQASEAALCQRIKLRKNDASEATLAVLQQQQHANQPFLAIELESVIAVNTEAENALTTLLNVFEQPTI